jgi:quinol monooxygenase YgiN
MIGIVATLRTKEGKGSDLEAIFRDLTSQVRQEPGNLFYRITKSRDEANVYKVIEFYTDEDSVKAHMASAHFAEAGKKMRDCLAGRPELEYLDGVV